MKRKQIVSCLMIVALVFAIVPSLYAAAGYESGDTGSLGNNQWRVRVDGDLEPNVDSTYDIGQSGNEVATVYTDAIVSSGASVFDQVNVGIDGGAADHYYASMTPGITAYATGTIVIFRATAANTGACDLDVNGLGVTSLKMLNNQDPAADYIEAGSMVMAVYDFTDDVFELISPDANP